MEGLDPYVYYYGLVFNSCKQFSNRLFPIGALGKESSLTFAVYLDGGGFEKNVELDGGHGIHT